MTAQMTEDRFLQLVRDLATMCRWRSYHTYRSDRSDAGFPDLVLVKGSRVVFAELKSEKGRVAPAQLDWLTDIQAAGQEVALWRPSDLDEIRAILGPRSVRATLRFSKPSTRR